MSCGGTEPEALGSAAQRSTGKGEREEPGFDARFTAAFEGGRVLVSNLDAAARHDPPFVLACVCEGRALDQAIKRVSTFAYVMSAIIAVIVVSRAAPWPIGTIALVWLASATMARLFAAKRRRQHGKWLVDFERDVILERAQSGAARVIPVEGGTVRVEASVDSQAPFWLVMATPGGRRLRLARGRADELRGMLQLFRSYNYNVNQDALTEAETGNEARGR